VTFWSPSAFAQTELETEIGNIMSAYEQCVENAKTRTLVVKKEALRPKFFAAKLAACDRIRDAEISSTYSKAGIAEARRRRAEIKEEMAAMTEALLAGARAELGLATSN